MLFTCNTTHLSIDIDECTSGSNTCDDNAECHDTDGSYWCQCLPGFQGDGYNCTSMAIDREQATKFRIMYLYMYCWLRPVFWVWGLWPWCYGCHLSVIIFIIFMQIMSVLLGTIHVRIMQSVMILMVATGVSVYQDSREMDTTAQVCSIKALKEICSNS